MQVVYERCAGLDVHKKTVVACRLWVDARGVIRHNLRTFGTMMGDLLALRDWLACMGITHVAMESSGVYWRPVYNILEGEFVVLLVNAKHIKFVPGRKTDIKDAHWIAQLLQHGLLKASFIPDAPQRELRELVRYRSHLVNQRSREINRVHKVLEDANLKLSSVASNIMGDSGREMLTALIAGQDDPQQLAQLAQGRMRSKIDELERALTGQVKDSHRRLLSWHLGHIDDLCQLIAEVESEIDQHMTPFDQDQLVARLSTMPGLDRKVAQVIIAELGTDLSRFPSASHAASWAGLVPGKHESAGRNYSARTNKANRYLKAALVQAAHAAGKSNTYLGAQYRPLKARRGAKRAAVAVAHSILVIAFHIMQRGTAYVDLGPNYFDQRKADQLQRQLVKRLERLGYLVSLTKPPDSV